MYCIQLEIRILSFTSDAKWSDIHEARQYAQSVADNLDQTVSLVTAIGHIHCETVEPKAWPEEYEEESHEG